MICFPIRERSQRLTQDFPSIKKQSIRGVNATIMFSLFTFFGTDHQLVTSSNMIDISFTKRSSSDKICSPIRERSPKLYTVFPSYVFPYTYCHISENDYTHRHICFLSCNIIQSRIMKGVYNDHKDFHRISSQIFLQ